MSTTRELVDMIVDLRETIHKKDAIIEKLQAYVAKNSLNAGENAISLREYDALVAENAHLRDRLDYYETGAGVSVVDPKDWD
jgi:hypothetical protein